MSAYNDFMVKAHVAFVYLSDMYCNQIQLGVPDCCLENKITLLAMYLDTIPRTYDGACLDDTQLGNITYHINELIGNYGIGNLTSTEIPTPSGIPEIILTPTPESPITFAWNTTIGVDPTRITFDIDMGSVWGMSYIIYNSQGYVVDAHISDRDNTGFTVTADEDFVHFEGIATKVR